MSLRRLFLLPFTMLAFAFAAVAPAGAFEQSLDAYEITIAALDHSAMDIAIVDQVAEIRNQQPVVSAGDNVPAAAALGPIYALSLTTDGHSLLPRPHMRC